MRFVPQHVPRSLRLPPGFFFWTILPYDAANVVVYLVHMMKKNCRKPAIPNPSPIQQASTDD
jgi:hypothetical protein